MPTVTNSPTPPVAPAEGDLWFNTTTGRTYDWYIGPSLVGQWVEVEPTGPTVNPLVPPSTPPPPRSVTPFDATRVPNMTVSQLPPPGPLTGDLWFDTYTGREFIFYTDIDGSQWVVTQPQSGSSGGVSGSVNITAGEGILAAPNPITSAGTLTADLGWFQARFLQTVTAGTGITVTGAAPNETVSITNTIAAGGPVGNGNTVPVLTYNAQGQLTAVGTASITPASIGGVATVGAGAGITIGGTATDPTVAITNTIAAGGPTGNGNTVPVLTWNSRGQLTVVGTASITPASIAAVAKAGDTMTGALHLPAGTVGAPSLTGPTAASGLFFDRVAGAVSVAVGGSTLLEARSGVLALGSGGDIISTPDVIKGANSTSYLYLDAGNGRAKLGTSTAFTVGVGLDYATADTFKVMKADFSGDGNITFATQPPGTNNTLGATTGFVMAAIAAGASISVGTTPPVSPNPNQLWWNSDASTGGGVLYIYYNDGNTTQWVPVSPAANASGSVLQRKFFSTGTNTGALAPTIPADNTIPQQTEGSELMTLAITPLSASSVLDVTAIVNCTSSAADHLIVALFRDATANAFAVGDFLGAQAGGTPGYPTQVTAKGRVATGSTATTTFKVRGGCNGSSFAMNGQIGSGIGPLFGGTWLSSLTVEEVIP